MNETCPNGHDLTGPLIPEEYRHNYEPGTTHYSRTIGVEVRGVHDGVLYWMCPDCGVRWHRWPEGHPLRAKAGRFIADTARRRAA